MPADQIEVEIVSLDDKGIRARWVTAALVLVFAATAVRLVINFSYSYPPGTDAGYYPMQTRTWLLRGHLMYDDLPFLFWLNAALSRSLMVLGMKLDDAVLLASRILDSIIEPWAAIGIMGLAYAWALDRRKALLGCTAAAAFVVLSPPVVRMLSDFEKNSAGFVFMSAALWVCRKAMVGRSLHVWIGLAAILALLAITHLGVFATTLAIVVTAILMWCVLHLRANWQRGIAGAILLGGCAVLIALLASFDSARASKLMRAPKELFRLRDVFVLPVPVIVVFLFLIGMAMGFLWRDRANLQVGDIAIVIALAVVTLFAVVPKSYVYFDRLFLMVTVPASFLLAFIMSRLHRVARPAGFALLALFLFAAAAAPSAVQRPLMNEAAAAEVRNIGKEISDPGTTMVIAPHGLEWWAGYFLGTSVRSTFPTANAPLTQYRRVLFLRNTIDCPRDIVSPFGMPPVKEGSPRIYLGHYVEVYEMD
jgi:hypothetical protein